MAHFLCHLGCSHFGALLLDFYFTENSPEITFANKNVVDLLTELKKETKKDIWICGGASIVNQVLQAQMADEITISVMPILLGEGIKLFEEKELSQKLKLVSTRSYNGIVDVTYQMREA